MKKVILLIIYITTCLSLSPCRCQNKSADSRFSIQGWNILTSNPEEINESINAARGYNINHLELSEQLIMNLRQLRNPEKRKQINSVIEKAHKAYIKNVLVWDHCLYDLGYYPDKFKTGPGGTIDLDNPDFWTWFKQDYHKMMKLIPNVDGIVLTFVETGARAEQQYSRDLTSSRKLAEVINNVADVVIGELDKKLLIRNFSYTPAGYRRVNGCLNYLKYDNIIVMMKETPHDFFLTHPTVADTIKRPTIIEFDCGNEFNGQGVIANTWPAHVLMRWHDLRSRKNIIGYVARTDRTGTTSAINKPPEILLYTLKRYTEDTAITAEKIYNEFITSKYGKQALKYLKPAFKDAFDIATSVLYSLGTSTSNHSQLNFDPYSSSYSLHVSGRWINPPVVYVKHDVNRKFNYWKDIIQHIAPARFKSPESRLREYAPYAIKNKWVTPCECMNEEYLHYLVTEKKYGVTKAEEALKMIEKAKPYMDPAAYNSVYNTFYRTLLTAKLYEAVTEAYFGYRIYARGESFRTEPVIKTTREGLINIKLIADKIEKYNEAYPIGQWNWKDDAKMALDYYNKIAVKGWPAYGGVIFHDMIQ